MSLDERLVDLLMRAEELRDQGREVRAEELCRHCPDLLPELRRLLRGTGAVEQLLRAPTAVAAVAAPAPAAPLRLPGFTVHRELGRGGMGIVYDAEQQALGRRVALKILPVMPGPDGARVARFLREVRAAARLQHPHIVPVFEVGQAEGVWYYAMQFIPGRPLSALVGDWRRARQQSGLPAPTTAPLGVSARVSTAGPSRPPTVSTAPAAAAPGPPAASTGTDVGGLGRLSPDVHPRRYFREVARLGRQVAEALACAHTHGVLHRDVKPANLLVDDGGRAWVADFGLAKIDDEDLTQSGALVGTLRYMAPEQMRGAPQTRSDIYSLGITLYELLTLRPAFDAPDQMRLFEQVAHQEPPRPRALDRRVPRDLETIILKATRKEPERRYASAQELADDLGRFLEGRPVRARPTSPWERAVKWARRRPAAAALLAVCLAAGLVLLLAAFDRAARRRRVEGAATEALNQAAVWQERAGEARGRQGAELAAKAREQAQRALALVEEGPADAALRERVRGLLADLDAAARDRRLLADLDAADLAQADTEVGKTRFIRERAVPLYRAAFRDYGLPAGATEPAAAAARLRGRPDAVREAALAALDEWVALAEEPTFQVTEPNLVWLRAVRAAAESGGWWKAVRDAAAVREPARRRSALEELAAQADVAKLPARALTQLARRLLGERAAASAVALLRRTQMDHAGDFWVNEMLGVALPDRGPEAVRFLTAAVAVRPDSAAAYVTLGLALYERGQFVEAAEAGRRAVAVDPNFAAAHAVLGLAVWKQGRPGEAAAAFRRAVAVNPNYALAHNNLGALWQEEGKLDDAAAAYRRAVALDPRYVDAHHNLAGVLLRQRKLGEAIEVCDRALALDPNDARAHFNLGSARHLQGKLGQAAVAYGRALALDPKYALAHNNLGLLWQGEGKLAAAAAAYRRAVALDPKYAEAHKNLGDALFRQGRPDEAAGALRRAVALEPQYVEAHVSLGYTLLTLARPGAAAAAFRQALAVDRKHASAHVGLGFALQQQGKLGEADALFRLARNLLPSNGPQGASLTQTLRQSQRWLDLERKRPQLLAGEILPTTAAERLEYAQLCHLLKHHANSARLYAEAFDAAPDRAGDFNAQHRFRAACAAAQAGAGRGEDATALDDRERVRWTEQALAWLRADLASQRQLLQNGSLSKRAQVRQRLQMWRQADDLGPLRDPHALAEMPDARRGACRALWAEAEALLNEAQAPPGG